MKIRRECGADVRLGICDRFDARVRELPTSKAREKLA